ncbi:hypothetical protein BDY19DRAFT_1054839 [Irpex rosettiformis]|uniref:Uncharacterized protein n=1 Tax=Irpex rosettiformis TaxID=378272 RepID=A0ACB8UAW6_9APHY|nr:hypothetical protein BDY19DRAFT_1054839 [Irpex rosettiformis]
MIDVGGTTKPYLIGNKASILHHLDDDVLGLVCANLHDLAAADKQHSGDKASLRPLSTTCKRLRALCIPYIFQTFKLEYRAANPWAEASWKLEGWNTDFAPFVREVIITLKLAKKADEASFISTLPDTLASVLITLTSSTSRLESFTLEIEPKRMDLFAVALVKQNVVFTSVRRLKIGHYGAQVLDLFPNTMTLAIHGLPCRQDGSGWNTEAIEALPRLSKLQSLYLGQTDYGDEIIEVLLKAIPNIKTLVLPCGPQSHFDTFISKLASLREVEVLCIADEFSQENIGFCPPYGTDPGYMYPKLARQFRQQGDEANDDVTRTGFSQCPRLTELWLGSYASVPNLTTTMDHGVEDSRTGELEWSPWATDNYFWNKYF